MNSERPNDSARALSADNAKSDGPGPPLRKLFCARGHLVDSGIMKKILDAIVREGGSFEIAQFDIGRTNDDPSTLEAAYTVDDEKASERIARHLTDLGVEIISDSGVNLEKASVRGVAPRNFYSTTNHSTSVDHNGSLLQVENMRMDGVVVIRDNSDKARAFCVKLRDLRKGDQIVVGLDGIKVAPEFIERDRSEFGFMVSDVSSERVVRTVVDRVAEVIGKRDKKVIAVAGPVVAHTGGGEAFSALVAGGFISGLLSGNALAVHDIESQLYGTSLGINIKTGEPVEGGHSHHLRAINEICRAGSIKNLIEEGALTSGVMYSVIKTGIPYVLAGSIRDDGPIPEAITDMNEAQDAYFKILEGADVCLMLSSMLHSIAVGNMIPARVLTVCVDINPAVVTKLKDRGSHQTIGVVTDVGLFLHLLAERLCAKNS
ncbi:MAG: TIGR00300 family protein [candidate division Zixibacteria bacterium]|nr:TIGR00300 family protein [candidate division Zixibacteria bacterium]